MVRICETDWFVPKTFLSQLEPSLKVFKVWGLGPGIWL